MIRSVLAVSDSVLSQLENAPKLTTHEKNLLQDIVEILTPLKRQQNLFRLVVFHLQVMFYPVFEDYIITLKTWCPNTTLD